MARSRRRYNSRPYRRSYRKNNSSGLNLSTPFLVGALVGYTDQDKKLPAQLVLGAATAPVRGMGVVKGAAQGVVFGNLVQQVMGAGGISSGGFKGI